MLGDTECKRKAFKKNPTLMAVLSKRIENSEEKRASR